MHFSHLPAAGFATSRWWGVFVTAFYSFRMYFLVFHGKDRAPPEPGRPDGTTTRMNPIRHHGHEPHHERPMVVTLPLVLLAIPSVVIGFLTIQPDAVR